MQRLKGLAGFLAIWPLILGNFATAINSYIFIAPNVVRPGREFSIQGELLKSLGAPVKLTAELKDGGSQIAQTEVTVNSKQAVNLDLLVPTGLKPKSKYLQLTISGTGGLTFRSTKSVEFEDKSVSVYIQTDKQVYKPGQTIRMRIFGTTPELTIVNDKLKVEIHDPQGNKINQWDVSGSELNSLKGVYVQEQVLSEYPLLGEWKIKAKLLSYSTEFTEKIIKVEKYVLPKFEVELDLPSFGRTTDSVLEGKVKAKYTFGKPVKGEASLLIQPKKRQIQVIKGVKTDVTKKFEMKFPINGKASFVIKMSELEDLESPLSGNVLEFKVNVTESLTKARQSDEQELSFYSNPIKVEFPKSLPDTFKPDMQYDMVVKVSLQDGTPPEKTTVKLSADIKEYHKVKRNRDCWWRRRRWARRPAPCYPYTKEEPKRSYSKTYDVPPDGIVMFPLKFAKDVTKVVIKASHKGASASFTLKKRHSPTDSFLQITTTNNSLQAGQTVSFNVRSTSFPVIISYQIYSKGTITKAGTFSMNSKFMTWSLPVTSSMAPRARVIFYYIRSDGEVVADALTINVQGIFQNQVAVSFNTTETRPATGIKLNIEADAMSEVSVLAVDKSVLLLGTGNDISSDQVIGEVNKFDTKSKKRPSNFCDWFCWRWPLPSGGEDVKDVFDEAGVIVISDANVYEHREIIEPIPFPRPGPFFGRAMRFRARAGGMNFAQFSAPMVMSSAAVRPVAAKVQPLNLPSASTELAPVQKVRKLFPETWLWTTKTVPNSGVASIEAKVPDTITSWIATAFAVHPDSGLGLSQTPAQLQVSTLFFMIVSLPYSVVRGEKVILQVTLHNYSPRPLEARVFLHQSTEFENIEMVGNKQRRTQKEIQSVVTIPPNEVAALYLPIVPITIGTIDIKLEAMTVLMSDGVVKKLLVEAEGTPREYNLPVVIDMENRGTYTEKVKVEFPPTTVPGSERVTLKAIGDLMGPTLKGLGKLLSMPSGCGEQNMLKFAPNIFIAKYMEATNTIDDKTMKDARNFMEKGYQRELTYSHPDGSYSAFGSRDKSGSTWLTAFVVKSFVQAKPYIFIDDDVVIKAVNWLVSQQNSNGTFNEPGRVIHKEMQGGSTSGQVALTSYVLISLLEAKAIEGVSSSIQSAADKAQAYLESQISDINNVYDLAIMMYALQLAGSTRVDEVWNKLDAKAIIQGGTKHWEKVGVAGGASSRKGKALNVELTAYVLLALAERQDRVEGVKVLKWLTKQRNPNGGFSSTQDTVVALQGLAEMAALVYRPVVDLDITVTGTGYTQTLRIDNTNAQVLQRRDLPSNVGEVTITATGQGFALVQIGVFYNIKSDDQKDSFMVKTFLPRQTVNDFDIQVCASYLKGGSSSMAVIEIGSPSGFVPEEPTVISEPKEKMIETEARKIILYYDEITSQDTCVTVTMQRVGMVAGVMPVPIRVYDYYEPSNQVTDFYVPEAIRNSDICDMCGEECTFCKQA